MTIPNIWALSYVRDREEFYNADTLRHFLTALAARNCRLVLDSELVFFATWRKYIQATNTQTIASKRQTSFEKEVVLGVSQSLLTEAKVYLTEHRKELTFQVCSMAQTNFLKGFQIAITLVPIEGYILISVEQERFLDNTTRGLARYQYWLELIKTTYEIWHPLYVHEFNHFGTIPNPNWEEVRALNIPALYTLNIYGPELVEKLGQKRLLFAPAWKIERCDDGGILLIPEQQYGTPTLQAFSYHATAQHLGFPTHEEDSGLADANEDETSGNEKKENL